MQKQSWKQALRHASMLVQILHHCQQQNRECESKMASFNVLILANLTPTSLLAYSHTYVVHDIKYSKGLVSHEQTKSLLNKAQ